MFPAERPGIPREAAGRQDGDTPQPGRTLRHGHLRAAFRYPVLARRAAAKASLMTDDLMTDRYCQRLIKKRGLPRRAPLRHRPAGLGALTGVRPGKLLCGLLRGRAPTRPRQRGNLSRSTTSRRSARGCALTPAARPLRAQASLGARDIRLYVGIPFCPTRCAYCSFVSQSVEKSMKLIPPFLDALYKELTPRPPSCVSLAYASCRW